MMNQVMLIGRLTSDIQLEERNNKKYVTITLAVPRSFKNENGEYETDFIKCALWGGIAENTMEYCKKGDLLGVKGRLEQEQGTGVAQVVAEKITFLSSKKSNED